MNDFTLKGKTVFLSASFPEPAILWNSPIAKNISPLKTTSAVKAIANTIFLNRGKLIFGGHPTITPLILNVGQKFKEQYVNPFISIYQSLFFEEQIIREVQGLATEKIGEIYWTPSIKHDREKSLALMREKMLRDNSPDFCVLIGGHNGIMEEYRLFKEIYPGHKLYPLGTTGGASQEILIEEEEYLSQALKIPPQLLHHLKRNFSYPYLAQLILKDALS